MEDWKDLINLESIDTTKFDKLTSMNRILENIIEQRNGHYCHCLEVEDKYQLEETVEQLVAEFKDKYSINEIIDFFESIEVYYLGDDHQEETEIYSFNMKAFISEL